MVTQNVKFYWHWVKQKGLIYYLHVSHGYILIRGQYMSTLAPWFSTVIVLTIGEVTLMFVNMYTQGTGQFEALDFQV